MFKNSEIAVRLKVITEINNCQQTALKIAYAYIINTRK